MALGLLSIICGLLSLRATFNENWRLSATYCGQLSLNSGLLKGTVAHDFGLLGVQGSGNCVGRLCGTGLVQSMVGITPTFLAPPNPTYGPKEPGEPHKHKDPNMVYSMVY